MATHLLYVAEESEASFKSLLLEFKQLALDIETKMGAKVSYNALMFAAMKEGLPIIKQKGLGNESPKDNQ